MKTATTRIEVSVTPETAAKAIVFFQRKSQGIEGEDIGRLVERTRREFARQFPRNNFEEAFRGKYSTVQECQIDYYNLLRKNLSLHGIRPYDDKEEFWKNIAILTALGVTHTLQSNTQRTTKNFYRFLGQWKQSYGR